MLAAARRRAWHVALLLVLLILMERGDQGHARASAVNDATAGGEWTPMAAEGAPSPRRGQVAAWTGTELLIWGGEGEHGSLGDGAAYNPRTNAWRPITSVGAPLASGDAFAVWTGKELLVWGGIDSSRGLADSAAYDPATDTWRPLSTTGSPRLYFGEYPLAAWTGKEMLLWFSWARIGGRYDPVTDTWRPISNAGAPGAQTGSTAVWTGAQMLVWGGWSAKFGQNTGSAYDPATNSWAPLPTADVPIIRDEHSAVWTGDQMLIWGGGAFGVGVVGDGAAYAPATHSWQPITSAGAPIARAGQRAVWTGREMLIWGGLGPEAPASYQVGGAYDPATTTWRALPTAGAPSPRIQPTAVWTGSQLLIWGGEFDSVGLPQLFGDGAVYTPPAPHDNRYFAQTGFRIDNAAIWDYFTRRGGVPTFGYPTSQTFLLQGFLVQFFQRRVVQLDHNGHARLLNLLAPGLMPYTRFNGSTFPGVDQSLVADAPDPTNQRAVLAWVRQHAPDVAFGAPVNCYRLFADTVTLATAFPSGGDPSLLPGIDLELWGIPISAPMVDPNNHNFMYLRWQRGIMHYDASCHCTQDVLLADYFKAILTGQNLPADLAQESASSSFRDQYDPSAPNWVRNPSLLPNTNLTEAFASE